jgi:hypothetical protein
VIGLPYFGLFMSMSYLQFQTLSVFSFLVLPELLPISFAARTVMRPGRALSCLHIRCAMAAPATCFERNEQDDVTHTTYTVYQAEKNRWRNRTTKATRSI